MNILKIIVIITCLTTSAFANISYVGPKPFKSFPTSAVEINRWIYQQDIAKIRQHAWDLWAVINKPTENKALPIWETWFSGHELFELNYRKQQEHLLHRNFEVPHQFIGHKNDSSAHLLTSFNRYSRPLAEFILEKKYNQTKTLKKINEKFNKQKTPVAMRQISTSAGPTDYRQFVLKPVFQMIDAKKPTAIPYWAGISPKTTTDLEKPQPHTWRQCVVVDPTGKYPVGSTITMPCNSEPAQPWPVISINDFYHFRLTASEVEQFSKFAIGSSDLVGFENLTDIKNVEALIKPGNIALLMAMHITNKEISNWTWQTFWWSANPKSTRYGADRPNYIKKPWSNYDMSTAYFMVTPVGDKNGQAWISFNPYLETNLSGTITTKSGKKVKWTGRDSNCMSCHRMAAWKPIVPKQVKNNKVKGKEKDEEAILAAARKLSTPGYFPSGFVAEDDPIFSSFLKTDFLWSIPSRNK